MSLAGSYDRTSFDLIVVGAGAAGAYAAICAARAGAKVALLSASPLRQTASWQAQGGLAAALSPEDSPTSHLNDTIIAGRGLVRESAAKVLCDEAVECFEDLRNLGVHFDNDDDGRPKLSLEGGHSHRRVAHAGGSATGRHILSELAGIVVSQPKISVFEQAVVDCLLTDQSGRCIGVNFKEKHSKSPEVEQLTAPAIILATGGAAALWSRTTNPPGSTGVGFLLARNAGATLADLEFVQFHPTAVAGISGIDGFLVTEAVRGEGATLHDKFGERFVNELEPRDVVARAIVQKLNETSTSAVFLDMTSIPSTRFPELFGELKRAGVDPAVDRIPVAPAAHYTVGGIATDLDGATKVSGLFAVGECACTGLHGANRLASNSLSECFVFGRRAALSSISSKGPRRLQVDFSESNANQPAQLPEITAESRSALWQYAGLERNQSGLKTLLDNQHPLVRLTAASALERTESRGSHFRTDYPETNKQFDNRHSVIIENGNTPSLRFDLWE